MWKTIAGEVVIFLFIRTGKNSSSKEEIIHKEIALLACSNLIAWFVSFSFYLFPYLQEHITRRYKQTSRDVKWKNWSWQHARKRNIKEMKVKISDMNLPSHSPPPNIIQIKNFVSKQSISINEIQRNVAVLQQ